MLKPEKDLKTTSRNMCIALISTAHPSYSLVLIDNRDEFLNRPTAPASWWPEPDSDVLAGRDLLRSVQGTWLGATKDGRIAVLTNFREDTPPAPEAISRGAVIRSFLTGPHVGTAKFVKDVLESGIGRDIGGFSLVCGNVGEALAVISNRAASEAEIPWIQPDKSETVGLSNAAFGNRTWKKVIDGEAGLRDAIKEHVEANDGEKPFIQRLLKLLSTDTLPRKEPDGDLETYIPFLRETIFVPAIGQPNVKTTEQVAISIGETEARAVKKTDGLGVSGRYGTQKQTVVLVDHASRVRYFERTLYDDDGSPLALGQGDVDFEFNIRKEPPAKAL